MSLVVPETSAAPREAPGEFPSREIRFSKKTHDIIVYPRMHAIGSFRLRKVTHETSEIISGRYMPHQNWDLSNLRLGIGANRFTENSPFVEK